MALVSQAAYIQPIGWKKWRS